MGVSVGGFIITDDDLCGVGLIREMLAELIGTFYLLFIGCGGVKGALGNDETNPSVLHIALAFGIGVAGAVHLFSDISGAHLNPAVSFGLFFARKCSIVKACLFSVAQIIGGLIATGILKGLFGSCPGVVAVDKEVVPVWGGLVLEFFGALFLVLTVLATTNAARGHSPGFLQPLSIGFAVFCSVSFMAPLTGCGINPARALATNIVENQLDGSFYIYIVGPLLASLVGGVLYEFFLSLHYLPTSAAKHMPLAKGGDEDQEDA